MEKEGERYFHQTLNSTQHHRQFNISTKGLHIRGVMLKDGSAWLTIADEPIPGPYDDYDSEKNEIDVFYSAADMRKVLLMIIGGFDKLLADAANVDGSKRIGE